MADNVNNINNETNDQAREYLKNLLETRDISRDITNFARVLLRTNEDNVELTSSILSTYRNIGKAINEQADNLARVLSNEKSTKDITKDILKNERLKVNLIKEELTLNDKIQRLEQEAADAANANDNAAFERLITQIAYTKKLTESIVDQTRAIDETNEANKLAQEISQAADKKTKGFTAVERIVKSIPGLKGLSEPFEKASAAARDAALNNKKGLSIFSAGAKGFASFFKGPIWITALFKVGQFFLDAMIAADKRVTDIAKNLSISKESARDVYQSFINSKSSLDAQLSTTKNITEAFNELADLSNFVNLATTKQIDTQIILTKEIGVSKEAALGFQSALSVSNIEADKGLDIVYDQIAAFANQNKIVANGRKIFEEINKTSKLIQLNFRGNFKELVNATLQANKLGLSLEQVDKIAGSLLDFEQSISSELEAELLTSRNINLEQARLYALNNDIAGLTEEIAKQGINAAEFASMNRIQQEAIAKTLGMQASELGESLYNAELIEQTAGNFTKQLRAQANEQRRLNNLTAANRLIKQAEAIEQGIISGKSLEDAQRSLDIQDKFNNALEQAKEIFSDIVSGGLLDKLVNILTAFVKSVQTKGLGATLITGIDEAAQREADLIAISNKTKNISVEAATKKSEIEQNKDINLLQNKKEILKNQIEEFSTFELISNKIDELFGTIDNPIYKSNKAQEIQAIQAQQQLPEVEKLLNELIVAVKSGGNVYLDSNKVGTTMAMGTYKVQ